MTRQLLCRKCGEGYKLHPEDRQMAWKFRKVYLSARVPQGHGLTINGEFHPLSHLYCDLCSGQLEGDIVVAVTMWRGRDWPPDWEPEYGKVMTPKEVAACDLLAGKREGVPQ